MRRESPIKRRNPSGEIVWVARYTGRDGKRRRRQADLEPRQGHLHPQERRPARDRRGLRDLGPPRHPRRVLRDLDRAPPAIRADQRDLRAPDQPRRRGRGRGHRPEGLADARAAPPPHPRPGRPHADERRSSHHRRRRHPPLALGDGRGRDHRRSLRPQPLQGHPHPRQRPEGEEEAPPDPRLQLRGDARASPRPPAATRRWSASSPTPA